MPELLFQKTNQKNKSEMECQTDETTSSFNEVHVLAIGYLFIKYIQTHPEVHFKGGVR